VQTMVNAQFKRMGNAARAFVDALMTHKSVPVQQLAGKDSHFVSVDGQQLHYTRHGRGTPIILIHGFAGSTYTWRELIPLLAPTHTVYAVDLLGFGLSDKPTDGEYSMSNQARLIIGFVEALGLQQPALVGHSMGAVIAACAALPSPARIGSLVLIDPGFYHGRPPPFAKHLFFPFDVLAAKSFYTKGVRKKSLQRCYYDQSLITDALVDNYLKPTSTPGAVAALARINKTEVVNAIDICVRLRLPTLLVWGRYDGIVPLEDAERVRQEIAGSQLAVIDDAGHMVQEEKPQELAAAILNFLHQR
jgi:2-hydroxymuconate-semialdehyde hydrolase